MLSGTLSFFGFLDLFDLFVGMVVRSEPSLLDPERPKALFIFARNGMMGRYIKCVEDGRQSRNGELKL